MASTDWTVRYTHVGRYPYANVMPAIFPALPHVFWTWSIAAAAHTHEHSFPGPSGCVTGWVRVGSVIVGSDGNAYKAVKGRRRLELKLDWTRLPVLDTYANGTHEPDDEFEEPVLLGAESMLEVLESGRVTVTGWFSRGGPMETRDFLCTDASGYRLEYFGGTRQYATGVSVTLREVDVATVAVP